MNSTAQRTLRALHGAPSWLPQTQTWMHTQLRCLPESVESHVVCGTTENLDQFPVDHVHALADSPLRWFVDRAARATGLRRELGHLRRVAREVGADVLHSHFGHIGWTNCEAARRAGLAHVVTFYGQDATYLPRTAPVWRERYEEMFSVVDLVLAEGPYLAKTIEQLGCPREKLRVHHLGIELDRLRFASRTWRPDRKLRVLLAGAFAEKKGMPYAIDALSRLRDDCEVQVTIIGDAGADPRRAREKQRILAAIERSGLEFRMLGFQPYEVMLEQAYEHDVFLSPSVVAEDGDSEGGAPVTILEMAATGMPVVSTTHCDIPEVIGPGGADLLAAERDVDGLVERLQRLLSNPSRWTDGVAAVRAHIEREYSASIQGERLAALYEEARERADG